jgi:hypothetical protein
MLSWNFTDVQQQAMSFLRSQLIIVEPEVYSIQYADIQYPGLVPVVNDGFEWAKAVMYMSMNSVGRAQWLHGAARDFPVADVTREQFQVAIEMAAIGYRYNLEEISVGARTPGFNIGPERAEAARRAYLEFVDDTVLRGQTDKGWEGLMNQSSGVAVIDAADVGDENGGTNSSYWMHKTSQQIMDDFNGALVDVYADSLQIEMADTVLMPLSEMIRLSQMQMPNLNMTALSWLQANNIYTNQTGRQLTIRSVRGLEAADAAGGGRAVFYRRDPSVIRFHLPMPHRFLPVFMEDPMTFLIPGIFRMGPIEIRRPGAIRYLDGISPVPA